jgi:exopolysaccharide production protein ExoQ
MVAAGVAGLVLAKSVGSIAGTLVAVAVGVAAGGGAPPPRALAARAIRLLAFLTIAAAVALFATQVLRPASSPFSSDITTRGSVAQRVIVGTAGLEVFERSPVFGVGWRQSDQAISDPEIVSSLRSRFRETPNDLFPDLTPTTVHNSYIQTLAELGIVGLVLLAAFVASLVAGILRLLRSLPRGDDAWRTIRALALAMLLIGAWFNENPIYGGQVETALLALFAGFMVVLGRSSS